MDTLDTPAPPSVKFLAEDDAASRRGSIPTIRHLLDEDHEGRSRSGSVRSRSGSVRSRTNSVLTRIPTRPELKTLTRVVKRPAVDIEFTDLTYTVNTATGRKHIIKGINGFFKSGEITCIMGPSGAGKSSLMNILVGYVSQGVGGSIYTNGAERQLALFNKLSAYIMQEDLLQSHLTVYESLLVAAHLKLGNELNQDEKRAAVEEILTTLNLKFCQNTRVERLSGGQKKRLAVALELVNNPPIIFLDEPTTGLDIVTTNQVISLLKFLARQGRTIVCTLHQPSSTIFHMLDHVYLLAKGFCIYQGTSHKLVPFLAKVGLVCKPTYNPADYVFEVLNKTTIKVLSAEIQNGKICWSDEDFESDTLSVSKICRQETLASIPPVNLASTNIGKADVTFPTSFLQQVWILFCRMMLQQGRNMTGFWIQLGHHLGIALMVGLIFQKVGNDAARPFDNFKFLISVQVFLVYTQVMRNVMLMPFEIKILRREYFNRWYSLKSYYTALSLAVAPLIIVFTIMFASLTYACSDQPLSLSRFLWFNINSIIVALVSEAIGFCIGSVFNAANGTVVTPAVIAPMLALAVYGMGFGTAVEPYMLLLMNISFMRHSLIAFSLTLWGNARAHFICPSSVVYCTHQDPRLLLKDLGMSNMSHMQEVYFMIGYFVLFKVLGFILLKYRMTKSKNSVYNGGALAYVKRLIKKS
uniref:ATP-binding cassette sub-family G member 5 n=1 Tax=Diaphorina citri TaxID=121845 RepID=A0A451FTB5_DIACI|nr:ATP-binding cassette sub-family G member 5 [Diaphorina citri]